MEAYEFYTLTASPFINEDHMRCFESKIAFEAVSDFPIPFKSNHFTLSTLF